MHMEPLFAAAKHPIFILGILQRSGTNYLDNLLLMHPDVKPPGLVWEDFILAHAEHLTNFVDDVQRHWTSQWMNAVRAEMGGNALLAQLGKGLTKFLEAQYRSRLAQGAAPAPDRTPIQLVTATPSVRNLHLIFDLFPNAAPVIIVRDGRALVESGVRSFGWDYDEAMRMWAKNARRIIDFCNIPAHQGRFLLVRYEDLYTQTNEVMDKVLNFLGLNPDVYDFAATGSLGVMGSSELARAGGKVHWKAMDKSRDFNPLARASQWSSAMNARFAWIAGDEMRALGYTIDARSRPVWNKLLDYLCGLGIKLKRRWPWASTCLKSFERRLLGIPGTAEKGRQN